ncbi:hypothetical protein BC829DRAFT_398916 [Chytridium lagenaria]|nr:hypothetical protein BC829DRAFT_398916 [Chytridium lagenaria]
MASLQNCTGNMHSDPLNSALELESKDDYSERMNHLHQRESPEQDTPSMETPSSSSNFAPSMDTLDKTIAPKARLSPSIHSSSSTKASDLPHIDTLPTKRHNNTTISPIDFRNFSLSLRRRTQNSLNAPMTSKAVADHLHEGPLSILGSRRRQSHAAGSMRSRFSTPIEAVEPEFAVVTRASEVQVGRIFFGHYESDALIVMRMMMGLSTIALAILALYSIVRVRELFINVSPNTFLLQNWPTGVSILFVAWGLSFHLLSHLIRIHYDNVDGREGMAGTSGVDEVEAFQSNLRNAFEAIDREESQSSSVTPASSQRTTFQKYSRWLRRATIKAWLILKREGLWFSSWADGEPDFADLAVEVRGETRAVGAGVKVMRLPMATTMSLASRRRPDPDEPWTIADAGGICTAREQEPLMEVLREEDLDPALVRMLLGVAAG